MGANEPTIMIEQVLKFAEIQYCKFSQSGKWAGATTKLTETSFYTKAALKCFNCGGNHHLSRCKITKNDARIEANRKLFLQNKKKESVSDHSPQSSTPTSDKKRREKYAPPTTAEKSNNNCCVIERFYFWKDIRWKPVKKSKTPALASVA